ncbi:MAG: DUF819 family protein [Acidobacteriota bacterium]|nr:DUF819 family protein [Acidobacteriota bacterium]
MESQPMFNDPVGVMAVIIMVPVFFVWLEKKTQWKVFTFLPAIIWIFLTPILLSNLGVIPKSSPIYDIFKSFAVPLFIVLMLLDINIREALRVAWRGAAVMVIGSLGIVAGVVGSFWAFRGWLPDAAWSGFGALAGSWIGGTGNLAAVAEMLDTPEEFIGVVVIADNFVYLVYFPIILMAKNWAGWFNKFSGVSQEQIDHIAEATKSVERKTHEVHFKDVLTLLGFGFAAILVANLIAGMLPEVGEVVSTKTWALLLVTVFGISLSATPLKDVPGSEPLSMTFVYIYMTMIGASADLSQLDQGAVWFLVAGYVAVTLHLLLIGLSARIFKIDVSMAAVASVAAVGGAASAPVAAGFHREELVPISIMLALIGYALGNFLGWGAGALCHMLI